MIPAVGQRVGPYEILGRLGSGGMGLVFSAWDSRLQRDVAIKLLREEFAARDMRERFLQEARAASGLNHPNICTIFDIGDQDGDPYLVMELLKGETLRSRIFSGPMGPEDILHIAVEISDALAAAHARGIIHRDVKPANIFLVNKPSGGWQAKVLDFGLAKIDLGDGLDARFHITGAGATVGTVSYMSPEQARGEVLDARSDLFALGIVLYEMAVGHVPFQGATSALVFVQLLSHPPEPLRELNPSIPKDLERIIFKLLAKDRTARFQSATEVVEALRRVVLKKAVPAKPGRLTLPSWGRSATATPPPASPRLAPPPPPPSPKVTEKPVDKPAASDSPAPKSDSGSIIRPVRRIVTQVLPPPAPRPPEPIALAPDPEPTVPSSNPELEAISKNKLRPAPPEPHDPVPLVPPTPPPAPRTVLPPKRFAKSRPAVFSYTEGDAETAPIRPRPKNRRRTAWVLVGTAVLLFIAVFSLIRWMGSRRLVPATKSPTLLLASVANRSGDKALDGVILEALRLDLSQSSRVFLPDSTQIAAAMRSAGLEGAEPTSPAEAQQVASALGATSFLFGEVRGTSPYIISIRVYDSANTAHLAQAEETAGSRQQIADAIDRLSAQVRLGLGETGAATQSAVPLAQEATSNIDALQSFLAAEAVDAAGQPAEAARSYEHALSLEPNFTQASLRLAALFSREGAELGAAQAATRARGGSTRASDRTQLLAQAAYELYVTGDSAHSLALLDQAAAAYPGDLSVAAARMAALRAQGKFNETLAAAQSSSLKDSSDPQIAIQAELSFLALDRGPAALQVESAMQRNGDHRAASLLAAFLNAPPGADLEPALTAVPDSLRTQFYRAQVLDATGRLGDGLEGWHAFVESAKASPLLASAAPVGLAQAALNRALTGNCPAAMNLAREASALPVGRATLFSVGMAQGLCGDLAGLRRAQAGLRAQYPQSFSVKNYDLPQLTAVEQMRLNDASAALTTLQAAKLYDLVSLTAYLRGLAHGAAGDWKSAIADFQFLLLHRGATTLVAAPMYPMAQIGLARAYAASGDNGNSAAAYLKFLEMWKTAGASDPLLMEARQHTR